MTTAPQTTLHLDDWAAHMADDCDNARLSIAISALSCLPPISKTPGQWPRLWASWQAAAARGVSVKLWLPAPSGIHSASLKNAYTADQANKAGIACQLLPGPRLLHCKSLVVDRTIAWIGSGNFTSAAAHHNIEGYLRSTDPAHATAILERWGQLCR